MRETHSPDFERKTELPAWLKTIRESVDSLQYGVVQIIVHNAKVVQIEKTEKVRFDPGN